MSASEADEQVVAGEIEPFDVHPIRKTQRYIIRVYGLERNHIPAGVIERAAGIYKIHTGEITWAKTKIENYAYRTVTFPRCVWKRDGLNGNFESDGPAPKGNPVSVTFKPRTPETTEAVSSVLQIMTMRGPMLRAFAKVKMREWLDSLRRLDALWPEIIAGFSAGPFTEHLNEIPPSQLPSILLHLTVKAFLQ